MPEPADHRDAYRRARAEQDRSNMARCYLDLMRRVCEVSESVANGYRLPGTNAEAANAAANTGYFTLAALGYSHEEVLRIFREMGHPPLIQS